DVGQIQTAGLDLVAVRGVDLRLVAFGEAGSVLGAEILPAVAFVVDLGLNAIAEVLVIAALAEQMAGRACADQHAILDRPSGLAARMLLPAAQVLAVKERLPFLLFLVLGGD